MMWFLLISPIQLETRLQSHTRRVIQMAATRESPPWETGVFWGRGSRQGFFVGFGLGWIILKGFQNKGERIISGPEFLEMGQLGAGCYCHEVRVGLWLGFSVIFPQEQSGAAEVIDKKAVIIKKKGGKTLCGYGWPRKNHCFGLALSLILSICHHSLIDTRVSFPFSVLGFTLTILQLLNPRHRKMVSHYW